MSDPSEPVRGNGNGRVSTSQSQCHGAAARAAPTDASPHRTRTATGWSARVLPRPGLALALWITWLMLHQSLDPAHLLGGALLALALSAWAGPPPRFDGNPSITRAAPAEPFAVASPTPAAARRVRLVVAAQLLAVVLQDIVLANVQVARLILGRPERLCPGYVSVPLAVRDPRAVSLLAAIITMTPGTVSAELSDDRTHLRVHALDLRDPEGLVNLIRERYERPILELMP